MKTLAYLILALLVNLTSGGTAVVSLTVCGGELYANVSLPVPAIPSTVLVVNSCTGAVVDYAPSTHYVLVPETSCDCPLRIDYIALVNVTSEGIFQLDIDLSELNTTARVIYDPNVIVIPESIEDTVFLPNSTIILKPGRVHRIEYIVLATLPPAGQGKAGQNITRPNKTLVNMTPAIETRPAKTEEIMPSWLLYAIVAVVVAIGIVLAVVLSLRRKIATTAISQAASVATQSQFSETAPEEREQLSDLDMQIVQTLKQHGGALMQSELYRILNVPRTTLWRAVRRLEKLGIVRVEKVGRLNRVVLLRDPQI